MFLLIDLPSLVDDFKSGAFHSLEDFWIAGKQLFSNLRLFHRHESAVLQSVETLESFYLRRLKEIRKQSKSSNWKCINQEYSLEKLILLLFYPFLASPDPPPLFRAHSSRFRYSFYSSCICVYFYSLYLYVCINYTFMRNRFCFASGIRYLFRSILVNDGIIKV